MPTSRSRLRSAVARDPPAVAGSVPVAEEVLAFGDLAMSVGVSAVLVNLLRRRRPPAELSPPASPEGSASTGSG